MWKLTKIIGKEKANGYRTPEYQQFLKLRVLSFVVIGLILVCVLLGGFFIYRNIFVTVSEAQQIIFVKSNLTALEIIDFAKFDQVKKAWNEKNSPAPLSIVRDPFNPAPTSTPPTP